MSKSIDDLTELAEAPAVGDKLIIQDISATVTKFLTVLNLSKGITSITLDNTGLHLLDTNATHDLIIAPGSDLTLDRTLSLVTGDLDRIITLSGNPTLGDWFDQAVKQASSPTFAGLDLTGLTDGYLVYVGAGGLANSPIYTDGTKVGIGTTNSIGKLHVKTDGDVVSIFEDDDNPVVLLKDASGGADLKYAGFQLDGFSAFFHVGKENDALSAFTPYLTINTNNGRVGIGKTPGYQLELSTDSAGKPSTNTWTVVSDERLKENIGLADLQRCYDILKTLPLKRFTWKNEIYTAEQARDRSKLGWISQDVATLFPKAVDVKKFEKVPIEDGVEEYEEQDFEMETVEEKVIEMQNGIPVQVKRIVERKKLLFKKDVTVVDETGKPVVGKDGKLLTYLVPIMMKKTRPKTRVDTVEDCLSMNADQIYAAMYGAVQLLIQKVEKLENMKG